MPKIFISHSSKDNDFAAKLADALRERGADVWIDLADIPAGMKWSTAIQQALKQCELMLLIITPDSMDSTNVEDEWQYYIDKKKLIIPVRWIPADVHFQLNRYQYVDFHGRDFETAMTKLSAELSRLGFALPTPPPAPPRIRGGEQANSASPAPVGTRHASSSVPLEDTRQFPIIIKPDWVGKIIPEPFEWCVVPTGQVTLEPSNQNGDYLKLTQSFLVTEFRMARFPITIAQFNVFVTASDGWHDPKWWDFSEEARVWRKQHAQSAEPFFQNCFDCPRETITWYSAVAFTRWLGEKTGESISLPTDHQWQRAAQGDDSRTYPWGKAWELGKCNSSESNTNKTVPVALHSVGASPFGVIDMSGNVWEWCLTIFRTGMSDLNGVGERIRRGGAFDNAANIVRIINRAYGDPAQATKYRGFRCISTAPALP